MIHSFLGKRRLYIADQTRIFLHTLTDGIISISVLNVLYSLTFTQVRGRIQSSLVKLTISKRKQTNASIIPLCSISKRNESIYKAKGTGLFLNIAMEANKLVYCYT